jgi:hypothetical protein
MKSVQVPVTDDYQNYLLDYLSKNPQLAAAYLNATLEEENPEPELLLQAMNQVYSALLEVEQQEPNSLLNLSEAKSIYKFVNLLKIMGLEINIIKTQLI